MDVREPTAPVTNRVAVTRFSRRVHVTLDSRETTVLTLPVQAHQNVQAEETVVLVTVCVTQTGLENTATFPATMGPMWMASVCVTRPV